MHVFNCRKIILRHNLLKSKRHFHEVRKGDLAFIEDCHAAGEKVDEVVT